MVKRRISLVAVKGSGHGHVFFPLQRPADEVTMNRLSILTARAARLRPPVGQSADDNYRKGQW